MSKIIPFVPPKPALEEVREQACAWVVKMDKGLTSKDAEALRAWLGSSPERVKLLMEAACIWDQTSMLKEYSEIFQLAKSSPRPGFFARSPVRAAIAASLVVVTMAFAGLYLTVAPDLRNDGAELALQTFQTQVGEQNSVVLADGSELILNTNTRVEVSYSGSSRDVSLLRGEAHFKVSKDATRPFRVAAGGAIIEAVGTAFAVQRIQDESLEVTVTEGTVNFHRNTSGSPDIPAFGEDGFAADAAARGTPVQVMAGESATLDETNDSIEKMRMEESELQAKLAWRRGMLQFQGDTLEQAIKEINRYTATRIDVDESIKDIEVVGVFVIGNIDGLLAAMSQTFNLTYTQVGVNHIVLSAREKE